MIHTLLTQCHITYIKLHTLITSIHVGIGAFVDSKHRYAGIEVVVVVNYNHTWSTISFKLALLSTLV